MKHYKIDISVTLCIMSENKDARKVKKGDKEINLRNRNKKNNFYGFRRMGNKDKNGYVELVMDIDVKKEKGVFNNWRSENCKTKYKDVIICCKENYDSRYFVFKAFLSIKIAN